jgi:cbb3-type cytochrome oxidase maturation protein
MSAIIILVLISLAVAVLFLVLFIISVKSGQYEDDYSPSVRILFDSEKPNPDKSKKQTKTHE